MARRIFTFILTLCMIACFYACQKQAVSEIEPSGDPSVHLETGEPDNTESDDPPPLPQYYNYEIDEDDLAIELELSDFFDEQIGKFVFPGIDWNTPWDDIAGILGVKSIPDTHETDPTVWITITLNDLICRFVPFFRRDPTQAPDDRHIEYCELTMDKTLTDNLDEKIEALLDGFTELYGDPEYDEQLAETSIDKESSQTYKMSWYRWETDVSTGRNLMDLIIYSTLDGGPYRLFIMLYNRPV